MKVRILSGNQAGQILELPEIEAQNAIDTGYGESAESPAVPPPVTPPAAANTKTRSAKASPKT